MGSFMYGLAVLTAIGALVGGVALILHTVPDCGPNPYDPTLTYCTGNLRPFAAAGAATLIGGLFQALVLAVIGRLCHAVSKLRGAAA